MGRALPELAIAAAGMEVEGGAAEGGAGVEARAALFDRTINAYSEARGAIRSALALGTGGQRGCLATHVLYGGWSPVWCQQRGCTEGGVQQPGLTAIVPCWGPSCVTTATSLPAMTLRGRPPPLPNSHLPAPHSGVLPRSTATSLVQQPPPLSNSHSLAQQPPPLSNSHLPGRLYHPTHLPVPPLAPPAGGADSEAVRGELAALDRAVRGLTLEATIRRNLFLAGDAAARLGRAQQRALVGGQKAKGGERPAKPGARRPQACVAPAAPPARLPLLLGFAAAVAAPHVGRGEFRCAPGISLASRHLGYYEGPHSPRSTLSPTPHRSLVLRPYHLLPPNTHPPAEDVVGLL